jgi:hypothetical protein
MKLIMTSQRPKFWTAVGRVYFRPWPMYVFRSKWRQSVETGDVVRTCVTSHSFLYIFIYIEICFRKWCVQKLAHCSRNCCFEFVLIFLHRSVDQGPNKIHKIAFIRRKKEAEKYGVVTTQWFGWDEANAVFTKWAIPDHVDYASWTWSDINKKLKVIWKFSLRWYWCFHNNLCT